MSIDKLISADSHVLEPPDLWEKRIYPKFRDRAPRLIREGNVDRWYVDQDMPAGSVGAPSQAGMRYENPEAMTIEADFEDVRPGAYDPHARLKDLEVDGVVGEVCIPTVATRFYSIPIESDLLFACFRAMNDWMAEFSKPYPNILKGIGIISLDDVQDGVKEFERCAKLGLAGVMIPTFQGEERHYYLPEYEPLWATAQEIGIPIVMHVNSQRSAPRVGFTPFATNAFSEIATGARMSALDYWVRLAVGDMIFGGVFERYPGLKVSLVEFEIGWVPYQLGRMDNLYSERRYARGFLFKEDKVPSDFFRSNVFVNFTEDDAGITYRSLIGIDNMMFGTDYPHRESTWPRSREVLGRMFEGKGVSEEEQRKIAYANAARLYKFD